MYKEDTKLLASIEIFSEVMEPDNSQLSTEEHRRAIEDVTNQGHLYQSGVLRACLTLNGLNEDLIHLFVFIVEQDVDKMYMVMKFPDEF